MSMPMVHPKLAVLLESKARGLGVGGFDSLPAGHEGDLVTASTWVPGDNGHQGHGFAYDMRPVLLGTAGRGSYSSTETEIGHLKLSVLVTVLDVVAVPTSAS